MRGKLGTRSGSSSIQKGASSELEEASSSEAGGEVGLVGPSFVKGELLIKGRQGARKKHFARLKIAHMFY
jgi:hypothetical protein